MLTIRKVANFPGSRTKKMLIWFWEAKMCGSCTKPGDSICGTARQKLTIVNSTAEEVSLLLTPHGLDFTLFLDEYWNSISISNSAMNPHSCWGNAACCFFCSLLQSQLVEACVGLDWIEPYTSSSRSVVQLIPFRFSPGHFSPSELVILTLNTCSLLGSVPQ